MRKFVSTMLIMFVCGFAAQAMAQEEMSEDEKGIIQAGKDYFEAFYLGDGEREAKALHPELAKRYVRKNQQGREFLAYSPRGMLIEYAASGAAKADLAEKNIKVEIFEVNGNIASGKVVSSDFYDYVHFVKLNGQWYVLNVLWTPNKK